MSNFLNWAVNFLRVWSFGYSSSLLFGGGQGLQRMKQLFITQVVQVLRQSCPHLTQWIRRIYKNLRKVTSDIEEIVRRAEFLLADIQLTN